MLPAAILVLAFNAAPPPQQLPTPATAAATASPRLSPGELVQPSGYTFEREQRERWLAGRQLPGFTSWTPGRLAIRIDSVRDSVSGARVLSASVGVGGRIPDPARMTLDGAGRVLTLQAAFAPMPPSRWSDPATERRVQLWRTFADATGESILALPGARIWELARPFHPASLRPGQRWTDRVDEKAVLGDAYQELHGTRISVLLGDTVLEGRRVWLVRDSAAVRYHERFSREERTLDTLVAVEREAAGVILGRYAWDPVLGLPTWAGDTTALRGNAILRYPDGRSFRTPVRFERMRGTVLYAPEAYAAHMAELRARQQRERGGMVILPRGQLERRLASGDTLARDSLIARWRAAPGPEARDSLWRLLSLWAMRTPAQRALLLRVQLAAGDTARAVASLRDHGWGFGFGETDTAALRLLLPFMADPGLAFSFGLSSDPFYENPRQALLTHPPVLGRDSMRGACSPEACRRLAAHWPAAAEPRLRALGLIARLTLEPARWSDTVLARAAAGGVTARFLEPAAQLARGAGFMYGSRGEARPLPPAGADWRAWLTWMSGRPPSAASPLPRGWLGVDEARHVVPIRFVQAATRRDVTGELRHALESATGDTGRAVLETLLLGLGAMAPDPALVAAHVRSSSPLLRELAGHELAYLFRAAPRADPVTTDFILDRLLAIAIEGAASWPGFAADSALPRAARLGRVAPGTLPVFLASDSLPAALRERWRTRVALVRAREWSARDAREAGALITPSQVARIGPFVRVGLTYTSISARGPDQAPVGYAGGYTLYLIDTGAGWQIVQQEAWVT